MNAGRVLVTGGAGFIGSHLCEGLLLQGYRVRVIDDLSVGKQSNVPSDCEFIRFNVLDEGPVAEALKDVDAIFHEAARVTIRGSVDHFYEDAETNLMGTLRLLKLAAKSNVRKFIYASSMAVYADSLTAAPVAETYTTDPASPYGIAKLAAERYVLMMAPLLGIEPVVLRYFNTFGIRQTFTPYVGVITIFVTRLLQNQPITVFGDGLQVRDFTHVSDIVQANLLALKTPDAAGKIFNVGSGRGTSVLDLAHLIRAQINPNAQIAFESARAEELRNSIADVSLAKKILGYEPKTDLEKQLSEVIEYLKLQAG